MDTEVNKGCGWVLAVDIGGQEDLAFARTFDGGVIGRWDRKDSKREQRIEVTE